MYFQLMPTSTYNDDLGAQIFKFSVDHKAKVTCIVKGQIATLSLLIVVVVTALYCTVCYE